LKPGSDNFNEYLFLTVLAMECDYDYHHHHRASFVVLEITVASTKFSVCFLTVCSWLFSGFKTLLLELNTCFGA
jgi:hypothetical protein